MVLGGNFSVHRVTERDGVNIIIYYIWEVIEKSMLAYLLHNSNEVYLMW